MSLKNRISRFKEEIKILKYFLFMFIGIFDQKETNPNMLASIS
jgi:hypothetical protein